MYILHICIYIVVAVNYRFWTLPILLVSKAATPKAAICRYFHSLAAAEVVWVSTSLIHTVPLPPLYHRASFNIFRLVPKPEFLLCYHEFQTPAVSNSEVLNTSHQLQMQLPRVLKGMAHARYIAKPPLWLARRIDLHEGVAHKGVIIYYQSYQRWKDHQCRYACIHRLQGIFAVWYSRDELAVPWEDEEEIHIMQYYWRANFSIYLIPRARAVVCVVLALGSVPCHVTVPGSWWHEPRNWQYFFFFFPTQ